MSKINFSVKNKGPSEASHVAVTLNGIEEVQLSEIVVDKGVVTEGRWHIGTLDVGESVDFDATATILDDAPSVSIKLHVHATTVDYNTSNNVIEIIVTHDALPEEPTVPEPATCPFTSDYSTGSMNFGIRNGKTVADMDGMEVDVIFAEGESLGIEVGSLSTDRPEKLGTDGAIMIIEDSGMYTLLCFITMSEDMSGYESVLTIGGLEIPFQFSSNALQAVASITPEQRNALIGMDELCISVDEPYIPVVDEPVGFVIKTTDGVELEIEGPGEFPGTGIYVGEDGHIEGGQLEEVLSWPKSKPVWLEANGFAISGALYLTKVPDTVPAWITDMSNMFLWCSSFNQDLSGWDTSNVTDMAYMFFNCQSFDQDISGWDTSNVTDMSWMFSGCSSFNGDVSGWDTSNVTDMQYMFERCSSFDQDISGWDVSNVTDMAYMFDRCLNFNQDISGWCVSNISDVPIGFRDSTPSWTLPKPIWGTCPQRFIRLDYRDAVEGSVGAFSAFGKYNGDLISGQPPAFLGEPVYRNGFYYHPVVYTNGSQSFTVMRISQEPEIDFNGSSGQSVLDNLDSAGLDRIEVTYAGVVSNYVVPRSSYTPSGNFLEIQAGPWPSQVVYNNCKNDPIGNFIKLFWN